MTAPSTQQHPVTVRVFIQRLSATPRGARLARHLALNQLHAWGIPHGTDASDAVALIVAELAANAVTHGRVPGRDFELRLSLVTGSVRVEVTDTRSGPRPPGPGDVRPVRPLDEGGRGLVLVEAVADRWEVLDREPPGKTVRAEVDLPGWLSLVRGTSGSPVPDPAAQT
ncbi:ATP-binding protein [Streptomyces sp. NBC_01340]|uniref:ATP-binding protein n=1 Tax=unclassified Streptomyces TaxID=2593676 RepID=UPI002256004D|nr:MULTISPECIES: ATP-binding protein [unclassified Streptomyces]MCX4453852.1 ATP-binding protein [Streptomyces sp. NBC_01719]MCX4493212.1 ATP-binding protein [Streptomyces sp. NBC_01728]WSI38352.1 ATP-binding protein [Streptomyces sp. NBC_01340]